MLELFEKFSGIISGIIGIWCSEASKASVRGSIPLLPAESLDDSHYVYLLLPRGGVSKTILGYSSEVRDVLSKGNGKRAVRI